jgi:hypothetical protein
MLKKIFQLKYEYINEKEEILVIGSDPELGEWDTNKTKIKLKQNIESKIWESEEINFSKEKIKYKYVIIINERILYWETKSRILSVGEENQTDIILKGELEEGWTNSDITLRLYCNESIEIQYEKNIFCHKVKENIFDVRIKNLKDLKISIALNG